MDKRNNPPVPRQQTNRKPNVYAFIDSQNLNLGVQKFGWKLDWRKFRKFLNDKYNVTHAYMFIGYMPDYESLYTQMQEAGYLVVLKPTLEMYNTPTDKNAPPEPPKPAKPLKEGEEEHKKPATKGNVDAELVLYAMKELPNYDKAIIVSGDGDFYCIVEYLDEQGKLLHLMAPNWKYSSLLKPYEKYVVRVDEFKRQLAYKSFRKPAGK
jgi:uncharacterized LabA/DUF88 family protein